MTGEFTKSLITLKMEDRCDGSGGDVNIDQYQEGGYDSQRRHYSDFPDSTAREKSTGDGYVDSRHPLWYNWRADHDGYQCKCGSEDEVPITGKEPYGDVLFWNPTTGSTSHIGYKESGSNSSLGGILGDEMGLGKTLEVISLIAGHQRSPMVVLPPLTSASLSGDICNVSKLRNRKGEINSRATIVVTPVSIINQWIHEIRIHAPSLTVCVFDGSNSSTSSLLHLAICDVVLVTYATLAKELNFSLDDCIYSLRHEKKYKSELSPLMQINWWRVVLDEAQFVESTVKQCALMAGKLNSVFRWW